MSYTLVLDAMGVIFASADDVVELLQPFIVARNGNADLESISDLYTQASLGRLSPREFWQRVGLNESVEDEYLRTHRLTTGVLDFLNDRPRNIASVWCLSNDVGRWSGKLRDWFGLNDQLAGAIISGDVGSRKPDRSIYDVLLSQVGVQPDQVVFVDDRPKNLATAHDLGIRTILFGESHNVAHGDQLNVRSFSELAAQIAQFP